MSKGVCAFTGAETERAHTPLEQRIAAWAAEQHGVLSTAQLHACGLDDNAIAVRVRRGTLHRIHRGVYAVGHAGLTREGAVHGCACSPAVRTRF